MNKSDDENDLSDDNQRGRKVRNEKVNKKMQRRKEKERDLSDSDDEEDRKTHRRSSKITLKVPLYEECVFPCNQWFAKDEGDGLFIRELKVKERTMFYKD